MKKCIRDRYGSMPYSDQKLVSMIKSEQAKHRINHLLIVRDDTHTTDEREYCGSLLLTMTHRKNGRSSYIRMIHLHEIDLEEGYQLWSDEINREIQMLRTHFPNMKVCANC